MPDDRSQRIVLLNHLADEFVQRYRKGERPSLQEYIDRHPELANDIRACFPTMVEMGQDREEALPPAGNADALAVPSLQRLGDYRILREIGHGGMGVVYEAEQVSLGRHVALKVLPRQLLVDARARQRFQREAKAAGRLHHTNIVPVFGVGEQDGLPYYVMQFIRGSGLDAILKELKQLHPGKPASGRSPRPSDRESGTPCRDVPATEAARLLLTGQFKPEAEEGRDGSGKVGDPTVAHTPAAGAEKGPGGPTSAAGRLSDTSSLSASSVVLRGASAAGPSGQKQPTYWQSVARLGVQVADALEHAHSQGVLHRDIKPSNLLLDVAGTVWVTDFGLAKADDQQDLTHTGDVLGTVRYMAPEAFEGKADARSDVYALGLTLYELAALRPAFNERERNRLIKQVTTTEPDAVGRVRKGVPRDLETIIHKAIERDPARRYQTAGALQADLQRFLDDQPIQARRLTVAEKVGRWARQHKGVAASLLALGLVLVTVAIGSTIAALRFQEVAEEKSRLAEEATWLAGQREEQRQRAEASQKDYQRMSARLMMERGISFCKRGRYGEGLLWLARGQELVPEEDVALEQSFRNLLGGWGRRLPSQRVILEFSATVNAAAFSPDGRTILVGCEDGTAWVWRMEPETAGSPERGPGRPPVPGKPRALRVRYQGPVKAVAFSPDGRRMATGGRDGTIDLWNLAGRELGPPLRHQGEVRLLVFSPDGKTLASGSRDHTARLWDVESARPVCEPLRHEGPLRTLSFSPDGNRLVTGADDGTARVWETASGKPVGAVLQHQGAVRSAVFSPDGRWVLTAGNDGKARLWDASTGRPRGEPLAHTRPISAVAFSPDGKQFVTACEDSKLHIWQTETLQAAQAPLPHRDEVIAVSFSPDGRTLLTGCGDSTARLWDAASGQPLGDPMRNHGDLHIVAFSPDGRLVLTAGHDHTVRLWDTLAGNRPFRRFGPVRRGIPAVAFRPDGQTLFLGSVTGQQYDRASGQLLGTVSAPGHMIGGAAYSPDGKILATGSFDGTVRLWDVQTGKPRGEPLQHLKPSWALAVAFSPDGRTLLTGSGNYDYQNRRGEAQLWDVATGRLRQRLHGHRREVTAVAFHPDGKTVATASRDHTVRFWETATGRPTGPTLLHSDWVVSLAFSPDGQKLLTGSNDRTARVWDTATGKQVLAPLEHPKQVKAVAFSPDGRLILTGCEDGGARLWDAATGRLVDGPVRQGAPVLAVAFCPDGRSFLTGTQDGFAYLTAVPLPWRGSGKSTRDWVRLNANLELDPSGDARPLNFPAWRQVLRRLMEAPGAEEAP